MSSFVPIKQAQNPLNNPENVLKSPSNNLKPSNDNDNIIISTPSHRVPFSPLSAKPQNPNVVRLLSMKKTNKYLSDADILSVAIDSSIRKTTEKAIRHIQDENRDTNNIDNETNIFFPKSTISKRLFDISQCSNHPNPALLDSPKETTSTIEAMNSKDHIETLEDNIITNICNNVQEEVQKEQQLDQHRANIVHKLVSSYTENIDQHNYQQQQANHSNKSVLNLIISSSDDDIDNRNEINILENEDEYPTLTSATPSTSSSPINDTIGAAMANDPIITLSNLKTLVITHILNILNTGSYEELLTLHGIGQVRALRILTNRNNNNCDNNNSGGSENSSINDNNNNNIQVVQQQGGKQCFQCIQDLHLIGMNDKTIMKFLKANAADIVS